MQFSSFWDDPAFFLDAVLERQDCDPTNTANIHNLGGGQDSFPAKPSGLNTLFEGDNPRAFGS